MNYYINNANLFKLNLLLYEYKLHPSNICIQYILSRDGKLLEQKMRGTSKFGKLSLILKHKTHFFFNFNLENTKR